MEVGRRMGGAENAIGALEILEKRIEKF